MAIDLLSHSHSHSHLDSDSHSFPLHTRLAPTPSGVLHWGNLYNFFYCWMLVRHSPHRHPGSTLRLRIDDHDPLRSQRSSVEEIFRLLDYVGIDWDYGPVNVDDFYQNFSQQKRKEYFRQQALSLQQQGAAYACEHSRSDMQKQNMLHYPGLCRQKSLPLKEGATCLRLKTVGEWQGMDTDLTAEDFIIWRRDDEPAYHLVSVQEDIDGGINCWVRGSDLQEFAMGQVFLAQKLQPHFGHPLYAIHHPLLYQQDQHKLSKSKNQQQSLLQLSREKIFQTLAMYLRQLQGLPVATEKSLPTTRDEWVEYVLQEKLMDFSVQMIALPEFSL